MPRLSALAAGAKPLCSEVWRWVNLSHNVKSVSLHLLVGDDALCDVLAQLMLCVATTAVLCMLYTGMAVLLQRTVQICRFVPWQLDV